MRIEVGPVPSESVIAYVALARERLDIIRRDPQSLAQTLTPHLMDVFVSYLDRWERVAKQGGEFMWADDLTAERLEYVSYAFFLTVQLMTDRLEGGVPAPGHDLRAPFRTALVVGFLSAMEGNPEIDQDRLQYMKDNWPGPAL